jgi:Outer membrane protein beta-barrel domain
MPGKRFCIAVLFAVAITAALASAQDEKNEVSGVIGRDFIKIQGIQNANYFDPNIRYGDGLTVEGSYARRVLVTPIYSVTGEVPVLYNPDEDLHSGGPGAVPKDYSALFVAPSVRVNLFPTTAVSFWGSVGGGFGHISENGSLLYGGTNTGKSTTSGVLQFGVGLDVRVKARLFVRVEARDYWAGTPDFPLSPTGKSRQSNYFVGGGVMWRF